MAEEHPFLDEAFAVRWSRLDAGHVAADMRAALGRGSALLAAIEELPDGAETFANTFLALEEATEAVAWPWRKVNTLDAVNDHPELRAAHKAVLPEVSAFFAAIPLNQALYRKLRAFERSPAHGRLGPVERRFVAETLQDFVDAGAELDAPVRARLQQIESELAEKTKRYAEHVLDSTNAYEKILDSADALRGLPPSLVEQARQSALAKGYGTPQEPRYRLTLQAPSFIPAMRYLESDALRKELFEAYARIGHHGEFENGPLIREILALRREKARLLGRASFPDWVLARRMAKSGAAALAFVERLHALTKAAFDRENAELARYKAEQTGQPPAPLNPWETAYWAERLRRDTYAFDEEALRPYFPLPAVMDGLFALAGRLFGIAVRERTAPQPDVWHPSVRFYDVFDAATGRHIGSFYADWFPRESKRAGAWMANLLTGQPKGDGSLSPHLGMIAGNMSPPVDERPALLTHREVETVFHEFGHLLHHLLSEVPIRSLAGTRVAWDFVELPSQIMENWCWERESLDLFARHHETGAPIPEELFQKMRRARTFGAARMQMRQLAFGKLDLALHLQFDPDSDADLDRFIDAAIADYLPPSPVPIPNTVRAFSHLFSDPVGYAAGYYSYKWAEVLDADAFTRFTAEGILNPATGAAFRREVLARGNAQPPEQLFRAFMGRDPDPAALLRRLGIRAPATGN